jgi:hypothetical protein
MEDGEGGERRGAGAGGAGFVVGHVHRIETRGRENGACGARDVRRG